MTDERFYCPEHKKPVNYLSDIKVYICQDCPHALSRDEIITEQELLRSEQPKANPISSRTEVHFE